MREYYNLTQSIRSPLRSIKHDNQRNISRPARRPWPNGDPSVPNQERRPPCVPFNSAIAAVSWKMHLTIAALLQRNKTLKKNSISHQDFALTCLMARGCHTYIPRNINCSYKILIYFTLVIFMWSPTICEDVSSLQSLLLPSPASARAGFVVKSISHKARTPRIWTPEESCWKSNRRNWPNIDGDG